MAVTSSTSRFEEGQRPFDPFSPESTEQMNSGVDFFDRTPAHSQRLWHPLSYHAPRPKEIKDFDLMGERIIGAVHRMARSRRRMRRQASRVITLSDKMKSIGEREFDEEIELAREMIRRGRRDNEARVHAYAVVRESIRRTIGLSLYEEQVMGGWVMGDGCVAEMATGEGKTITACLTAAVEGWMGFGIHVITVNDYLAKRDADINHKVYHRLGLSVGVVQEESDDDDRREAYRRDITYSTDKQVIFDFLRDRLRSPLQPRLTALLLDEMTDTNLFKDSGKKWTSEVVQRGLAAAIIDEADSILIDEASTPAIIGAPGGEDSSSDYYHEAARISRELHEGEDFTIDQTQHRVDLTDRGIDRLEEMSHRLPAFWAGPRRREELIVQALNARHLFFRDDHYIIREGEVQIVDASTGRVLDGRQWQLGLHQAIQAKEEITVTAANETVARISYQRYFQRYRHMAGMTGTAWEVRQELWRNYHLPVVRIPTHEPMIRKHESDRIFVNSGEKFKAVADSVEAFHAADRPVLIGTRSVECSEILSELLTQRKISHRILNAVRHEEEAAIVTVAGKPGAVTVATNMAGRGTDILLGRGVKEMGGLVVLATERHETYRIDRQLYGRSGRQGDPGLAQSFASLDDQLIETSGMRWLTKLLKRYAVLRRIPLTRILWYWAQRQASKRSAMSREMASKHSIWFDRALHFENR